MLQTYLASSICSFVNLFFGGALMLPLGSGSALRNGEIGLGAPLIV